MFLEMRQERNLAIIKNISKKLYWNYIDNRRSKKGEDYLWIRHLNKV